MAPRISPDVEMTLFGLPDSSATPAFIVISIEVKAKLEKPVNFLANWRQNKGIRRGVSGAYLL